RTTTPALGASVGGAAAITVLPFTQPLGQPDDLARRIARNTPVILARESQIGAVRDAAAGAYYVESLTRDLAARAWAFFREIEAAGGIAAMLATGDFQRRVASVRAAREAQIATGEMPITGVNVFPNLDEPRPETRPWPAHGGIAGDITPLSPIRFDAAFARLRRLSDEYLLKTGARPAMFFANLGTAPDFAARTARCTELLACGGIEAVSGDGFATTEAAAAAFETAGTPIVCISASDVIYEQRAAETARALTKAGAEFIALTGDADTVIAAGVDALIYPGCDGAALLTRLHEFFRPGP
ncbi:MAG: methylmalonyl-CoA mutase family protein, partial [Hyphomicrobiales bacterium]